MRGARGATRVDERVGVTQLRLGITSTYDLTPEMKPLISLTEVSLRSFPE